MGDLRTPVAAIHRDDPVHLDTKCVFCHHKGMPGPLIDDAATLRRARIVDAARWCFLNFGFAKTSMEDIAKQAGLSRTLLYRTFSDKEDIYTAVFVDWLVSRQPKAEDAANGPGSPADQLFAVCHLMVLEPWAEMVCTPMGHEFLEACERIAPESEALYRKVVLDNVNAILGDEASAQVFLLALDGLLSDKPSMVLLKKRLQLLIDRFAYRLAKKGALA